MERFRWAVVGTGGAARAFTAGLHAAPGHEVTLIGSRSVERGEAFAKAFGLEAQVRAPYDAVGAAGDVGSVDAVYVATPPSTHRDLALAALAAGHPVLVEKPFTTDAASAGEVVAAAAAVGVLCMEAMWTRFLPLARRVDHLLGSGVIGDVIGVTGSFGTLVPRSTAADHLHDPALGGGALLDRGVYPLSFAVRALGVPDSVVAERVGAVNGVDEECVAVLRYGLQAVATVQASLRGPLPNDLRYVGTHGSLVVRAPVYRPVSALVRTGRSSAPGPGREPCSLPNRWREAGWAHGVRQAAAAVAPEALLTRSRPVWRPYRGNGRHYQALEVARCVRAGLPQSPVMPLTESVAVLETVDRVRTAWAPLTTTEVAR
jgi:predicted dehydrogenase